MDPGSAADWFAAVGTVGAFGAALAAVWMQRKELAEQREAMNRQHEEARRDQANHIYAMLQFQGDFPLAQMVNQSSQPAYDVEISAQSGDSAVVLGTAPTLGPGNSAAVPLRDAPGVPRFEELPTRFNLVFRDSAGFRWRRDADGELTELRSS